MFYDKFSQLCGKKNISPTKACEEMGLSRSIATKWKKTGATPSGDTLHKIAAYFNVSVDYLLERGEQQETAESGNRVTVTGHDGTRLERILSDEEYNTFIRILEAISPVRDDDI